MNSSPLNNHTAATSTAMLSATDGKLASLSPVQKATKAVKSKKSQDAESSIELLYANELKRTGSYAMRDGVLHQWVGSHFDAMDAEDGLRKATQWLQANQPHRFSKATAKSLFESACLLMEKMPEPDPKKTIIPLRNAYLEVLSSGAIKRHQPNPSFGVTSCLNISLPAGGNTYSPAPLPSGSLLHAYIKKSLPDSSVQAYAQELAGNTLTSSTRFQVAMLLQGGGRNGKSVLVRLLSAIHPRSAPMRMDKLNGFALTPLVGASLAIAEELPSAGFDEQTMKALISGESVTIDRKYLSPVSYRPSAKWVICTNHTLRSRDNTTGFWRRLCIVPFTVQIQPNDVVPGLDEMIIENELTLFLDWCLVGLTRLIQRGRLPEEPSAVLTAKSKAILASDPIAAWIHDEEVRAGASDETMVSKDYVYSSYVEWSKRNGQRPQASPAFWAGLRSQLTFPEDSQHRQDGKRKRFVSLSFGSDSSADGGYQANDVQEKHPFDSCD